MSLKEIVDFYSTPTMMIFLNTMKIIIFDKGKWVVIDE